MSNSLTSTIRPGQRTERSYQRYAQRELPGDSNNVTRQHDWHSGHRVDIRNVDHTAPSPSSSSRHALNTFRSNITQQSEPSYNGPAQSSNVPLRDQLHAFCDFEIDPGTNKRRRYLTEQSLNHFWTTNTEIQYVLETEIAQRLHRCRIPMEAQHGFRNFRRVACTMIWTDWGELSTILPILIAKAPEDFCDARLPWNEYIRGKAEPELGVELASQFFKHQDLFLDPIEIGKDREYVHRWADYVAFPFVTTKESVHQSIQSNVQSVWVIRQYLHNLPQMEIQVVKHENTSTPDTVRLACRRTREDERVDQETRDNTPRARILRGHPNIVSFIDVIQRGTDLYSFFTFPSMGSLKTLMENTHRQDRTSYQSQPTVLLDLLRSLSGLVDGSCHLLGQEVKLSLSADNVLIYKCDLPFGLWKIFDFEIGTDPRQQQRGRSGSTAQTTYGDITNTLERAALQSNTQQYQAAPGHTFGTVNVANNAGAHLGNRITTHIHLHAGDQSNSLYQQRHAASSNCTRDDSAVHNPYRAPEWELRSRLLNERNMSWSIGCIMAEIISLSQCLSRMTCGRGEQSCWRHLLYSLHDGPFFTSRTVQLLDSQPSIQQQEVKLHHDVRTMLLSSQALSTYELYVDMVAHVLQPVPARRWTLTELRENLLQALEPVRNSIISSPDAVMPSDGARPVTTLIEDARSTIDMSHAIVQVPSSGLEHYGARNSKEWSLKISTDHVLLSFEDKHLIQPVACGLMVQARDQTFVVPGSGYWEAFRLNGCFGVLSSVDEEASTGKTNVKWFVFNIWTQKQYHIPIDLVQEDPFIAIRPGHTGLIAFVSRRSIWLHSIKGNICERLESLLPCASGPYEIIDVVFGTHHEEMFVLLEEDHDRKHQVVQCWQVGPFRRPLPPATVRIPINNANDQTQSHLLPSDQPNLCFVLQNKILRPVLLRRGNDNDVLKTPATILPRNLTAMIQYQSFAVDGSFVSAMHSKGTDKDLEVTTYSLQVDSSGCALAKVGMKRLDTKLSLAWALIRPISNGSGVFDVYGQDSKGKQYRQTIDAQRNIEPTSPEPEKSSPRNMRWGRKGSK